MKNIKRDYGKKLTITGICMLSILMTPLIFIGSIKANPPTTITTNYGDVTLSGGFQAGHFDDIWDLTAGKIELSFTYDAYGLVDDLGSDAHAWAELGVRTAQPPYPDFNPSWNGYVCTEESFSLVAGQHIEVGEVVVQRVGSFLYVEYVITEDDWFITSTHLAVNESLSNIPQTKNYNPIPGKFPYKEVHEPPVTQYAYPPIDMGEIDPTVPLYIAAHAEVIKKTEAPYYASGVVDYLQGLRKDGSSVLSERSNPEQGLEFESSQSPSNFFSLGFGGWIIVEFDCPIHNGESDDLKIIEDTWGTYPLETADIYASQDGSTWIYLGNADNTYYQGIHTISTFDLGALDWAKYIKIVDTTDPDPHSGTADGFDLNAVESLQDCPEIQEETAWGDGFEFEGKNWATYIFYDPDCVSVQGSGVWLATDYDWSEGTFDPDLPGSPSQDLDDKLILQKVGGQGEGDYDLPSTPPNQWANHRIWFDRDGVDQWQAQNDLAVDGGTYNTGGTYDIVITLEAFSDTVGTAYLTINGLNQGFETDSNWNTMELSPAGMTFTGDMKHLQVFYGLYGYGATHEISFTDITLTQTVF